MTAAGVVHVVCAALALIVATVVFVQRKGTAKHVRLGRAYVVLLLVLNVSAALVPSEGIGPFHVLAVVSLLTVAAGWSLSPRRLKQDRPHAILMVWSVAGVVAAGLAQPATGRAPEAAPWPVVLPTALVVAVAALATVRLGRRATS